MHNAKLSALYAQILRSFFTVAKVQRQVQKIGVGRNTVTEIDPRSWKFFHLVSENPDRMIHI